VCCNRRCIEPSGGLDGEEDRLLALGQAQGGAQGWVGGCRPIEEKEAQEVEVTAQTARARARGTAGVTCNLESNEFIRPPASLFERQTLPVRSNNLAWIGCLHRAEVVGGLGVAVTLAGDTSSGVGGAGELRYAGGGGGGGAVRHIAGECSHFGSDPTLRRSAHSEASC
jgi:hypothetical protein